MVDKLGYGPGNSMLAGIAIVLGIPFPVWLYFNGEKLRENNKYTRDSWLRANTLREKLESEANSRVTSQAVSRVASKEEQN